MGRNPLFSTIHLVAPMVESGYQIGGGRLSVNEWRFENPYTLFYSCKLADEQLFSTEEDPHGTTIEFSESSDWKDKSGLKADLELVCRRARYGVKDATWHLLVADST